MSIRMRSGSGDGSSTRSVISPGSKPVNDPVSRFFQQRDKVEGDQTFIFNYQNGFPRSVYFLRVQPEQTFVSLSA